MFNVERDERAAFDEVIFYTFRKQFNKISTIET